MPDLTLEEFRGKVPVQELAARLREDACIIRGLYTDSRQLGGKIEPRRKGCFSTLADRFLRLSFRAS